jgi:hypothetical protein
VVDAVLVGCGAMSKAWLEAADRVLLQRYWLTMHGGRWASSARLTAHAALSNKSAMTTAWPRIS